MTAPLSDLHAMLATVERRYDAIWANRVSNDPAVLPFVRGYATGNLDLSIPAADRSNILLCGEHGFQFYTPQAMGLWEVHTSVLPSGRGAWTLGFVQACLHWMFTRTSAIEIFTRCPKGNVGAAALAKAIHGKYEATQPQGWVMDRDPIPADMYSLSVIDWSRTAPGLVDRGHWFHERLEAEYARHGAADPSPHPADEVHDRTAGLAAEMFLGGQPGKAVMLYNRLATMAGYAPITIVSFNPLTVNIQDAVLVIPESGDFFAATVAKPTAQAAA